MKYRSHSVCNLADSEQNTLFFGCLILYCNSHRLKVCTNGQTQVIRGYHFLQDTEINLKNDEFQH